MQIKPFIMCVSHTNQVMYSSELVVPVGVGKARDLPSGWRSDREGENIADRNQNYCELTAIYWAWKNLPPDYTHVGLFHYRRILWTKPAGASLKPPVPRRVDDLIDRRSILDLCAAHDVVLPFPLTFQGLSLADQYVNCHIKSDWEVLIDVLLQRHPDRRHEILRHMYGSHGYHPFNMFILKRSIFDAYCAWLFSTLAEIDARITISADPYQARVFGFMAERLQSLFFGVFCRVPIHTTSFVAEHNRHLSVNSLLPPNTGQGTQGKRGVAWLESGMEQARNFAREALENQAAGDELPSIHLVMPVRADSPSSAQPDLLASDWFPDQIGLSVVPQGKTLIAEINAQLLHSGADWLGILDGGDLLEPATTFHILQALHEHPDWQLIYSDEDMLTPDGQHVNPHCKPDFNLDYLRSLPYIGGLLLVRRDLFEALGGFDPEAEGAEDYDLLLRAWEHLQVTGATERAIGHIAEVLYHRRQGSGHTQKSVPEILAAGQSVLQAHFRRLGIAAEVRPGPFPPSFRVRWPLPEHPPLVSILVPTRNQLGMLQRCIESVIEKTKYQAYEIIIIDNDSDDADTCQYLTAIEAKEAALGGRLRVLRHPGPFNFSAMNNAAARAARGAYLLLLNNDTAALHDDWLDEMMGHAIRPDVGIVGAKLLFPNGKVQHAGVILGMRGPAEHPFINRAPEDRGYFGRAQLTQNLSAVTGACLLIRKSVFEQVGGLDEEAFKVSYNDIDLCLKVREAGLRIVFTPYALLLHEGSASQRGQVEAKPDAAKQKRFAEERDAMYDKWLPALAFDPAYNRHLTLASTDFLLEDQPPLTWDPAWRPRPRILVHPADREGCGEYRIIAPMRALNRAGMTQGWETMRLYEPAEMQRMDPDVLVVQRQMEWPQIAAIERHAKFSRAFRVFEIDDLITNLPVKSVHKGQIHKDITKRFRKAAGLCNRLVVATEPLAKAYAGFADEVVVCENTIEDARWGHLRPARAERARPRVGWAGGVGHTGDLELIVDVVRETAGEIDWVFLGMCPEALRPVVKEFHPGVHLDQYPAKLASLDLDLAVAPLEDNAFNEAKSHLRLLEYGILGYPVICSDLAPYQGDFPVTRVLNRYRDWLRAIREAVSDREALRARGDALRDVVRERWLMENNLDTWLKAWMR